MRSHYIMLMLVLVTACTSTDSNSVEYVVSLVADGRERTFVLSQPFTVEQFLSQRDVALELGSNDRLTPPRFTQLSDGMRITVVRVREETACSREELPFSREIIQNEGLRPGEERLVQVGRNGLQEVCYRTIIEDNVPRDRMVIGQPTVLSMPINEVVVVGVDQSAAPLDISGTLAYINNNNAWVIRGNTINKRPLEGASNLDSLVFSLSPDGRYLLYTAKPNADEGKFVNWLWLVETSGDVAPRRLIPTDVLYAEWIPSTEPLISYSTGEAQTIFPYWRALNNLWTMKIDLDKNQSLNVRKIVEESSGGLSGWWGTVFKWSPDGSQVAWSRADSVGVVGQDGALVPLLQYPFFRTTQNWSWRANLSWSGDGKLIATTLHGPPIGSEPAEASPVFNVVVTASDASFNGEIANSTGMWTSAQFSPLITRPDQQFPKGYLAYLRARDPYNSVDGEYDLVVADRDGSNSRVIFPASNQPGIKTSDFGLVPQDYTWSADGQHIALIYQGNLWVVDVVSAVAYQLTFDGQSQHPVWSS